MTKPKLYGRVPHESLLNLYAIFKHNEERTRDKFGGLKEPAVWFKAAEEVRYYLHQEGVKDEDIREWADFKYGTERR